MELVRWVVAGVLVAGGGTLVLVNFWIAVSIWRTKRHISFIPLIGSVAVTVGLLVAPVRVSFWALLPMAVDPGGPVWPARGLPPASGRARACRGNARARGDHAGRPACRKAPGYLNPATDLLEEGATR